MINLILSHSNRTFLILDLRIEPQTFRHTPCTLNNNNNNNNVKKGQFKVQFASNWSFGFLVPEP
jgi:hypothetical protein